MAALWLAALQISGDAGSLVGLTQAQTAQIIPLLVILHDGLREGLLGLFEQISQPIAWSALKLTLWTSAVMVVIAKAAD